MTVVFIVAPAQPHDQAVQFTGDDDLAAQPAAVQAGSHGAVEHLVLVVAHRQKPVGVGGVRVDMAGRAHR
jgi:hypothetical protein